MPGSMLMERLILAQALHRVALPEHRGQGRSVAGRLGEFMTRASSTVSARNNGSELPLGNAHRHRVRVAIRLSAGEAAGRLGVAVWSGSTG